MLGLAKKIYLNTPNIFVKNIYKFPERFLFGPSYNQTKKLISYNKCYFSINIYNLLKYNQVHTQYGREILPKNFSLDESKDLLHSLPEITSNELSKNLEYYLSDEYNIFNSYKTTTGGSGRKPTLVHISNSMYGIEWAYVHNFWSNSDYNFKNNLRITIRGKSLPRNLFYYFNSIHNELLVDNYKINIHNCSILLEIFKKYKPRYLFIYPSLVKEYVKYFKHLNFTPKLRAIFLSSEKISLSDINNLRSFFNCQILSFYGLTERVLFATDLNGNGKHRIYSTYGYPFLRNGNLLCSSFVNKALPLINFNTGDKGLLEETDSYLYLSEISSRRGKDFIYVNKSKKIPTSALNIHSLFQSQIDFYQIHQTEFSKIKILLVPKEFSDQNSKLVYNFHKEFSAKLSEFQIEIDLVSEDKLTKTHRGKFKFLVQDLIF